MGKTKKFNIQEDEALIEITEISFFSFSLLKYVVVYHLRNFFFNILLKYAALIKLIVTQPAMSAIGVVPVSLLLTLNIFHTLF